MKCAYHPEADAIGACINCGRLICPECAVVIGTKTYCHQCSTKHPKRLASQKKSSSSEKGGMTKSSKALARTVLIVVGTLLAYIPEDFLPYDLYGTLTFLGLGFCLWGGYLWTSLKNRHWAFMFWAGLSPIGLLGISLLRDKSKDDYQPSPQPQVNSLTAKTGRKIPFIQKARTGTGLSIQVIGGILWIGAGLASFIWTLWALFDAFGAWTILIALMFAPITYFAAIFIVWFSTGVFPIIVLILWLVSWVGLGIIYGGSRITGEDL